MAEWSRIATAANVPAGSGGEFTAAGRVVALYNVEGEFYALDGVCPHAGGPLGEGALAGNVVTCPWHGWQFDVTTGRHCLNANIRHTCIAVKVEDGEVYVQLPS